MRDAQFPLLLDQHLIKSEARGINFPLLTSLDDVASRLIDMRAIIEFAGADERPKIWHGISAN